MPASGKDTFSERFHKIDSRYTNMKKYRAIGQDNNPKSSYYNVTKQRRHMEKILEYQGLTLIKKYNHYYIRFIGGQREDISYYLAITNKEAIFIIASNELINQLVANN